MNLNVTAKLLCKHTSKKGSDFVSLLAFREDQGIPDKPFLLEVWKPKIDPETWKKLVPGRSTLTVTVYPVAVENSLEFRVSQHHDLALVKE